MELICYDCLIKENCSAPCDKFQDVKNNRSNELLEHILSFHSCPFCGHDKCETYLERSFYCSYCKHAIYVSFNYNGYTSVSDIQCNHGHTIVHMIYDTLEENTFQTVALKILKKLKAMERISIRKIEGFANKRDDIRKLLEIAKQGE